MKIKAFLISGTLACVVSNATALITSPADPSWWYLDNTISGLPPVVSSTGKSNFSPVNLGQLQYFAYQARARLNWVYANRGGAGPAIDSLISSFGTIPLTGAQKEANKRIANIGQLKAVAATFYTRLRETAYNLKGNLFSRGFPLTWPSDVPWDPISLPTTNYAPANLGQLKICFSFDSEDEAHIYTGQRKIVYVDAASSATTPNGTTIGNAYRTISSALGSVQPGDKIKIAQGIYREELRLQLPFSGTPSLPIVFEGVGNVVICGTDPITTGWQKENGYSDTYSTTNYFFRDGPQADFPFGEYLFSHGSNHFTDENPASWHPENNYVRFSDIVVVNHPASPESDTDPAGRMLLRRTSLSALSNRVWSFYIDGANKLYIHFPAGFGPSSIATVTKPLHIEASGIQRNADGSPILDSNGNTQNRALQINCSSGIHDVTFRGIRFINSSFAGSGGGIIVKGSDTNQADRSAKNWKFENCAFEGSSSYGVSAGRIENLIFEGCSFNRNGQGGLSVSCFDNLVVQNCVMNFNNWKGYGEISGNSNKFFGSDQAASIHSTGAFFDHCTAAFNMGSGLWFDTGIYCIEVSNSEFFGNWATSGDQNGNGIVFEVCGGPVKVVNNHIYSNFKAGLLISDSGVYHSTPNDAGIQYAYTFSNNAVADHELLLNYYFRIDRGSDPDTHGNSNPGAHYSLYPAEPGTGNTWGDIHSTASGNMNYPRLTVPTHKLFSGTDVDLPSDALNPALANSVPPNKLYASYFPPSGPQANEIPVFCRGNIVRDGTNQWHCVIYDCEENGITLSADEPRGFQLMSQLPTVALTWPVYIYVAKTGPGTVRLTKNEEHPAVPSPTPELPVATPFPK